MRLAEREYYNRVVNCWTTVADDVYEVIPINQLQRVVFMILIAALASALLCSCRASDKDLIIQLMHKGYHSDYQLPEQFQMEEPNELFRKYGAGYYRCTWQDAVYKGEIRSFTTEILIKNGETFPIGWAGEVQDPREVDFDHDGTTELIFYIRRIVSYARTVGYFVIEKGNEPLYYVSYDNALFEKVQDNNYIIRTRIFEGLEVSGVLKYRIEDGKKSIYIDAGVDTDKLPPPEYD
jgi:hypothetical protein